VSQMNTVAQLCK